MSEPMPYGEAAQELTYLRAQYEQFVIDRERERIIKLLWANVETMTHPYDNEVIQSLRINPKAFENLIKGEK